MKNSQLDAKGQGYARVMKQGLESSAAGQVDSQKQTSEDMLEIIKHRCEKNDRYTGLRSPEPDRKRTHRTPERWYVDRGSSPSWHETLE